MGSEHRLSLLESGETTRALWAEVGSLLAPTVGPAPGHTELLVGERLVVTRKTSCHTLSLVASPVLRGGLRT